MPRARSGGSVLIGRAPVRVSFAGGGTDLEEYYREYGGAVVSASINKYVYGIVTPNPNGYSQVISADYQAVLVAAPHTTRPAGELRLAKAILDQFHVPHSANVFLASEVPPGTGLGCSGAVAVNLINMLSTLYERPLSRRETAELAFEVEAHKLGAPVGKQDPYASAFGGLNCITFDAQGVTVEPLPLSDETRKALERQLLLFFTGNHRSAWKTLRAQRELTKRREPVVVDALHHIKALALEAKDALLQNDLGRFGSALHDSWQFKKQLAPGVTNSLIDEAYEVAHRNGALGGKITGAGGGGFLLVFCPDEAQPRLREALQRCGLHEMQFGLEAEGARILMHTNGSQIEVPHE